MRVSNTEKKVVLVTRVVFGKLIRKNRNEDSDEDDLRKADKNNPMHKSDYFFSRSIHQGRSENSKFVHGVKSDITAPEENSHKKPSHLTSCVGISTEAPKCNKETTIQDSDDNKKLEKILHLDNMSLM